jgi:hypothetical protein
LFVNTANCLINKKSNFALVQVWEASGHVCGKRLRGLLPFPLLGIDSDNGGEFINDQLHRCCLAEQITLTRSRPYQKNDQAHVEQKNWTIVRQWIGYQRYESDAALALLEAIYADLRLFINFLQPTMKLVEKQRVGSKVRKKYDTPQTPFQRVLASPDVDQATKDQLRQLYLPSIRSPSSAGSRPI